MQTPCAAIPDYLVPLIDQLRARLGDPLFVSRHRRGATDFTRRRTLTFPVVCLLLLQKTGKSVQRHRREFFAAWLAEPGAATVTPGAWTQARAKFKHTTFRELNQAVLLPLAYAPEQAAQRRTWRGHRLLGVDGSTLRLPATPAHLRVFGTKTVTNQGGATGTCYPEARMSVLCNRGGGAPRLLGNGVPGQRGERAQPTGPNAVADPCQRRSRMDTKRAVRNGSTSWPFSSAISLGTLLPSSPFPNPGSSQNHRPA
jgi:hypothetical protein